MKNKRYYWLKLDEKFFEDDTVEWLEEQENGKDYVIFYLKLCLKSLKDDGHLIRYVGEKLIPYDVKALARLTSTPVDTVAVAMKLFLEIGLVSRLDGGEIYLNQINEMIGSETDVAKRVRKHRAKDNLLQGNAKTLQCNNLVTKCNTEKEIEKEIDIEKEKREKKKDIYEDIPGELHGPLKDYIESRKKLRKPMTDRAMELMLKKLNKLSDGDIGKSIAILEQSVMNGWVGIFPLKEIETKAQSVNPFDELLKEELRNEQSRNYSTNENNTGLLPSLLPRQGNDQ